MRELYLQKPEELVLRNAPDPGPVKASEVKLKITHGGICGSDLRVYKGSIPYAKYPLRAGHEVIGVIAEAGSDVQYAVGTRCAILPNTFCGECEWCRQGKTNICQHKMPLGVNCDGLFAEQVVVEAKYLVPIPEEIPNERAILVEPLSVTVHALKKADIRKGRSVAILGCGTEGLFAAALALHAGADVTILEVNPAKAEIAQQLGAVRFLHPGAVGDELFDVVIEAAGVKASIEQSMRIVKPGGEIVAIGICGEQVEYPVMKIVRSEITIHGSIIYTMADWKDTLDYLKDPGFNVAPVLSKTVPLEQANEAVADALSGRFAKIVLKFD